MSKKIFGRIDGINSNDNILNLSVTTNEEEKINIKAKQLQDDFIIGNIYVFYISIYDSGDRVQNVLEKFDALKDLDSKEADYVLSLFNSSAPISYEDRVKCINDYIDKIDDRDIRSITSSLVNKFSKQFYIYPAAVRLHHAYSGGLAYHTIGMLKLSDGFLTTYNFLNKDYVYAGIILHDIGKVIEFTTFENPCYAVKGQLLGHLVIGGLEVENSARELGITNEEKIMILQHMIISHHGQPQFGAAKKPMTAEALVLWFVDMIDSKLRVLGEELEKTRPGEYTDSIGVLDKLHFYKPIN